MLSKKITRPKQFKVAKVVEGIGEERHILKLFITGISPHSARAVINSKAICEKYLKGRYELEIIDIYQQPLLAVSEDIIAVPVLIKKFPLPEERLIGDLSDTDKALKELHLV